MTSYLSSSLLSSPLSYENWSYQEQWDQIKQKNENDTKTSVIFDLHWLDNNNSKSSNTQINDNDDDCLLLLGCTSGGEVCCWKTPPTKNVNDDDYDIFSSSTAIFMDESSHYQKPIWRRRISNGTLYSVQVITTTVGKQLLVASGDEGVLIYDWNDCLQNDEFTATIRSSTSSRRHEDSKKSKTEQQHQLQPMARFQPYKSPFEQQGIEINSVAYSSSNGSGCHYLFGAAGDAFGCYKWDLEQQVLVATYQSPPGSNDDNTSGRQRRRGGGYLHTLELVPEISSSSSSRLLLTGGEDGVLGIWDTKADQLVDRIDMNKAMSKSSSSSMSSSSSSSRNQQQTAYRGRGQAGATSATGSASGGTRWISSCKAVNDTWWTVGGGCCPPAYSTTFNNNNNSASGSGGYIATFHAPTRSLVASVETRECIQQLAVTPTDNTLWSVGNENVACHWGNGSPYTLDNNTNQRRISCTSPSLYAVAITTATTTTRRPKRTKESGTSSDCMDVDMEDGIIASGDPCIAVSGVGPTIDLLENGGQPTFRFHL